MKYLDPVDLARLRNLRLSVRRLSAAGAQAGSHRSRTRGRSQDFSEHREYVPGDEIKFLDWKVYARKDRYFIREFQEERNLRTYVVVDGSGSMAYRGAASRPDKWTYGCHLASAAAYLVLARSDAAGLLAFSDKAPALVTPRARMQALNSIDGALAELSPAGPARLPDVLRRFAPGLGRRSLLVVVSDLLGSEPEKNLEVLKALRTRGHELLVLQVLDPVERDLDLGGPVLFKDLEGPLELRCDVEELRAAYRREFERGQRVYESSFRTAGIAYDVMYTDKPWLDAFARSLARLGLLA
jgi:uncharacterized protein (DUF58 family)